MSIHTEESLRAQIAEIDRLIGECGENPNLERLVTHLKGRRATTEMELERIRRKDEKHE